MTRRKFLGLGLKRFFSRLIEMATNWSLKCRVTDDTRTEYGWSYRTEQIKIILLQEIRDELVARRSYISLQQVGWITSLFLLGFLIGRVL